MTLSSALLLVEVALPTFGTAGISGFVLLGAAGVALSHQNHPWWPLTLIAVAVCLWGVFLVRRSASAGGQLGAAALYAGGSVGYGLAAHNPPAIAVGAAATAALAGGFPALLRVTRRFLDQPAQVGMDALIGRTAVVVRWDGGQGTVRLDGSLWNAAADVMLLPGDEALVVDFRGMILQVIPAPGPPF